MPFFDTTGGPACRGAGGGVRARDHQVGVAPRVATRQACARAKFASRESVLVVSWRWLVDARGDKVQVDWPRLGIAVAGALALATVLLWVVPSPWDYAVMAVLAVGGIIVDTRLRRTDGNT